MTPPVCECHGEPMYRVSQIRPDHWSCRVNKRERDRAYLLTDKGRRRRRHFHLKQTTKRREERIQRIKELT